MKRILIISFLVILKGLLAANAADTTALNDSIVPNQHIVVTNTNIPQNKQASAVNINNGDSSNTIMDWFMDAIGSTRTIVTWEAIIIIILIIIVVIVGGFGIKAFKKVIYIKIGVNSDKIHRIETILDDVQAVVNSDKIHRIETVLDDVQAVVNRVKLWDKNDLLVIQNDVLSLKDQLAEFSDCINSQSRYFEQSINYLYQAAYSNIEQMSDQTQAREILKSIYHEMQIARLYRTSFNAENNEAYNRDRFAVLAYLEMNGTKEDIPHLEYVVQHDANEDNRRRAIEVIGIIRNRG